MGSLSNQFISQSYISLIHLGNDNIITSSFTTLQDGLGNSLNVSVNAQGDISASGNIYATNLTGSTVSTASLVTTSSFNQYTSSTNARLDSLETTSGSLIVSTSNALYTASFSGNTITFTKGNGNTFGVVLPDVSGSDVSALNAFTASIAGTNAFTQSANARLNSLESTTSSLNNSVSSLNEFTASVAGTNAFTQSAASRLNSLESTSGSLITSASNSLYTASFDNGSRNLTFTKGSGGTFSVNIPDASGSILPSGTISGSAQISALGFVSSSVTASSLTTASISGQTITFTKGDASTFDIILPSGSVPTDITALNAFTASVAGTNAFTQSADQRLDSIEAQSGSWVTSAITASSLVTASANLNTITFTKGDSSTFTVNVNTGSIPNATTIFEVVYTGENITKGDPLYISGSQGANPIVYKADASNPAKMPVTFVSNETIGASNTTDAIILGLIEGIDLTGYTAGQSIYVAEGGGWSASLPSGSNSITQLLGVVTKGGSGGKGLVLNPGPAQLPGLDTGKMWVGSSTNQAIEISTASFASSASFNSYTSSTDARINSLEVFTSSIAGTNAFTQSANTRIGNLEAETASYAKTNVDNRFTTDQTITGSLVVTGTITANKLNVIIESSSVIYSSGSNIFGDELSDVQILSGSTKLVGTATLNDSPLITSAETASYIQDLTALNNFTASVAGTNTFTQSAQLEINALEAFTASALTTASVNLNTITFTKGDASTFNITVNTGSAVTTDISALNAFTASVAGTNTFTQSAQLEINALEVFTASIANTNAFTASATLRLDSLESTSASVNTSLASLNGFTASVAGTNLFTQSAQLEINALEAFTASIAGTNAFTASIAGTNTFTQSAQLEINSLEAFTASIAGTNAFTASALTTASFSGNTLTFTKGNGTTFGVTIPDVSGSTINTGSFATTGSNAFFGNQTISGSLGISGSAITFVSGTLSGSVVTNIGDIYTDVNPVNRIITLTSASYAALASGSLTDPNALYIVSGSTGVVDLGPLNTFTASIAGTNAFTASIAGTNAFTASAQLEINALEGFSASTITRLNSIEAKTGSFATTGSNSFIGNQTISGSSVYTGSVQGNVVSMSIASNTASMDFNAGNFFTITLASGSIPTFINPTNIKAGQTVSLVVTQASTLSGSLAFPTTFKFASGSAYVPSAVTSSKDIVTFITVDTTTIYASSVKNLI